MKKAYVKPEVYFENFQLSANIAAGCMHKTNHQENVCGYSIPGVGAVFTTTVTGCTYTEESENYNGICYHNPSDDGKLFTS